MCVRHFITVADLTPEQTIALFDDAAAIKARLRSGRIETCLAGKTLGMIFEKASNRTRVSFEVGMFQLGGHAVFLAADTIRLGQRESIPDVARVLSGYCDAVMLRTYSHSTITQFAQYSSVPVINGLSDYNHPCQALADLFTVREKLGRLEGVKMAFVGDGNNVALSLADACYRMGLHFTIASPEGYELDDALIQHVKAELPGGTGTIRKFRDPLEAVAGADIIYGDVWVSMGDEAEADVRLAAFRDYQINAALMAATGKETLVMHCLPAHRGEEITNEVIESPQSIVFDEAENRMHVQKGLLKMLIAG